MRHILSNLVWTLQNLIAGLRLAFPVSVTRRSFRVTADQALILLLLSAGAMILASYPFGDGATFNRQSWPVAGTRCFLGLLVLYMISRIQRAPHTFPALVVMASAPDVFFGFIYALISLLARMVPNGFLGQMEVSTVIGMLVMIWSTIAAGRVIRLIYSAGWLRTIGLLVLLVGSSAALECAMPLRFWYTPRADAAEHAAAHVDTEQTYYAQGRLLSARLDALSPSRPGVGELYFLGFAGTSTQDVFTKEARSAQSLFDGRFDTRGRSLLLVNNPRTVRELPVASVSNLRLALAGLAKKMNVQDDILFLFLTSHGAPHVFSVYFPQLALDDLSDRELKKMLDQSGIRWRVLVISACYSGSFIDALKDPHTLILTAAAADRSSFGCSTENDFTYFGDAFINTALRRDRSFITAFERAKEIIAAREKAEKLTPSEPQIYIGDDIRAKLEQLDRRLANLPLAAAK